MTGRACPPKHADRSFTRMHRSRLEANEALKIGALCHSIGISPHHCLFWRRTRSERTRLAIIEAYLELLRRNSVMPTVPTCGQAGARCAPFSSASPILMRCLATADYAIAQGQAEAVARNIDGGRRTVSTPVRPALACEKWLPLWRNHRPGSGCRDEDARRPGALCQHRENEVAYGRELSVSLRRHENSYRSHWQRSASRLGSDAPLLRPFDGGRPRRLAVAIDRMPPTGG
jgi:hypothetical protein